jgi:hypothetical protein
MKTFKQFLEEAARFKKKKGESSQVLFHASENKFDASEIKPMQHFGTSQAARARIRDQYRDGPDYDSKTKRVKANVMAYRAKLNPKKGLEIDDHGENHDPISVIDSLHRRKHITKREHTDLEKKIRDAGYLESNDYEKPYQHITSFLKKKGIDHLHYTNRVEDSKSESKSYMIVDPKTSLRPIFQKKKGIVNVKRTER